MYLGKKIENECHKTEQTDEGIVEQFLRADDGSENKDGSFASGFVEPFGRGYFFYQIVVGNDAFSTVSDEIAVGEKDEIAEHRKAPDPDGRFRIGAVEQHERADRNAGTESDP